VFRFLWEWHLRRLRFSEEWRFHRDLLKAELKASGLSDEDVQTAINRRLGRRSRWRRQALEEIRGDWRGLIDQAAWRRFCATAWIAPACLLLSLAVLFVSNPLWQQLLGSLAGEEQSYVPLGKLQIIPTDFARFIWGGIVVFQIGWLIKSRKTWRLSSYAFLLSFLLAAFGMCFWVTACQLWIAIRWPTDMLQGICMLVFLFAYLRASLLTASWWRRDVGSRCPICLQTTNMPIRRGLSYDVLLNPAEIESVCPRGHGVLIENPWTRTFKSSPEFWEDLSRMQ